MIALGDCGLVAACAVDGSAVAVVGPMQEVGLYNCLPGLLHKLAVGEPAARPLRTPVLPPCMMQTYGKEGLPPNPDLLSLVVSPLHGFLYPLNN